MIFFLDIKGGRWDRVFRIHLGGFPPADGRNPYLDGRDPYLAEAGEVGREVETRGEIQREVLAGAGEPQKMPGGFPKMSGELLAGPGEAGRMPGGSLAGAGGSGKIAGGSFAGSGGEGKIPGEAFAGAGKLSAGLFRGLAGPGEEALGDALDPADPEHPRRDMAPEAYGGPGGSATGRRGFLAAGHQ